MLRKTMRVAKMDHILTTQIRNSLHIKKSVVDKLRHKRRCWFEMMHNKEESQVAKEMLNLQAPAAIRRGRPRHNWARQKYTEEEKSALAARRMTVRSRDQGRINGGHLELDANPE